MAHGGALLCDPAGYGVAFFHGGKILCSFGEERRADGPVGGKEKVFAGSVILGVQCTRWLVLMVEVVLRNPGVEEFVKSYREGLEVLLVRRGGNRVDRFLELRVHSEGDRKGLMLLPEGCEGRGWSRVASELSKALAFLDSTTLIQCSIIPSLVGKNVGIGVPSYAAVLRAEVSSPATVEASTVRWDPLGKD